MQECRTRMTKNPMRNIDDACSRRAIWNNTTYTQKGLGAQVIHNILTAIFSLPLKVKLHKHNLYNHILVFRFQNEW